MPRRRQYNKASIPPDVQTIFLYVIVNMKAGIFEIEMSVAFTTLDTRRWRTSLFLKEFLALFSIIVHDNHIRDSSGGQSNSCIGPPFPPLLDLLLVSRFFLVSFPLDQRFFGSGFDWEY